MTFFPKLIKNIANISIYYVLISNFKDAHVSQQLHRLLYFSPRRDIRPLVLASPPVFFTMHSYTPVTRLEASLRTRLAVRPSNFCLACHDPTSRPSLYQTALPSMASRNNIRKIRYKYVKALYTKTHFFQWHLTT